MQFLFQSLFVTIKEKKKVMTPRFLNSTGPCKLKNIHGLKYRSMLIRIDIHPDRDDILV